MNLKDLIEFFTEKLENPNLSPQSKVIAESTLKELKGKRTLIEFLNNSDIPGKKFCWRYCQRTIETCDVCERCIGPEDLAANEI